MLKNVFTRTIFLTLAVCSTSMAQIDSTPSIRAFGLYYNGGLYSAAQAQTMAYRYDMVVLGADAWATTYYGDMINSLKSVKPNAVVLVYNSTDLGKVNNSKSTAYEWDSLRSYAGGYPHQIFYHSLDQQALTLGTQPDIILPGLLNNSDSSLSENGRFIGYEYRRHLNFGDAQTRAWQVRFNKSTLSTQIGGTSYYADGTWWDNCAVSQSLQQRQSESPTSVIVELGNLSWPYDQSWFPAAEQPNQPLSATRARFEQDMLPMLRDNLTAMKNGASWHPTGKPLAHATNWAEVRFDVEWSPYYWRTQMYDSTYTKYAYMEHTPNPLKPAVFLSPGASNSASSISTSYWGAKGPIAYFSHDTLATKQGVCVIYHPGFPYTSQYKPYGVQNRLYSDIAVYYLIRTDSTYFKIHSYNTQNNIAPSAGDSVMWIGAYAYDISPSFPMDSIPFAYASSVSCTDCDGRMQHDGLGKDGVGQNWVVFRRNLPNGNMVMHRAVPAGGTTTGNSTYTPDIPLGGQYHKLQIDGLLGPEISSDKFRNGEGGVYVFAGSINNTPPSVPAPTSPTGNTTTSTSPSLTTNASTDPDNTSLTYTFQVSKFQNFSSIAVSGAVSSSSTSQVSWQVTPALQGLTGYWWRVKASDFLSSSGWSTALQFQTDVAVNSAPTIPSVSSPPNGSSTSQTSPSLRVVNSSDVDGDAITYDYELYTSGGATLISSTSGVTSGASITGWTPPGALSDGLSYSWRARANDGQATSSWSSFWSFSVNVSSGNSAPDLPEPVFPASADTVIGLPVTFSWQNSFDPDGDTPGYDLWILTDSSGGSDLDSARNISQASSGSTTNKTMNTQLTSGRTYWWRLRANDGQAWTGKTTPWPFVYLDFSSSTESGQATTADPRSGAVANTSQPTLVANNITPAGGNYYYFDLATDSFFASIVTASPAVPEGQGVRTAWTVDLKLKTDTVYYWRVKANDNEYSLFSSFTVSPSPHASPVPFRPATDGFITFHELPEGADLVIITMDGEIVKRINGIVSGTMVWDGANANGQPVASGVYLWYIFGSDMKGKLIVQR